MWSASFHAIITDEKLITVAFVLAGFDNADVNMKSDVGVWLQDSYDEVICFPI